MREQIITDIYMKEISIMIEQAITDSVLINIINKIPVWCSREII
jgi:hypothetical protein